jgi:hypothetical protein
MIFVQQHLLRKTKRSNVKVMFLNFIKIIRMELGIKLSNHITIKSILNSLKNIYILILFSSGSWMLSVKSITFTWLQPYMVPVNEIYSLQKEGYKTIYIWIHLVRIVNLIYFSSQQYHNIFRTLQKSNHEASNWLTLSLAVASRVYLFCNLQSRSRTHAILVIGCMSC